MSEDTILKKIRQFQESMEGVEIIKTTEGHKYYYASLPDILDIIEPKMKEVGIWYQHFTDFDIQTKSNIVITWVYCINNEHSLVKCKTIIDGEAKLASMNRFMVEGSAITYFRRYHLTTLLGLTTDEDSDAGGKKIKGGGRSVDSNANAIPQVDFIKIFTDLAKTKTQNQFSKTFEAYKTQMNDKDIEAVNKIMKEKYG